MTETKTAEKTELTKTNDEAKAKLFNLPQIAGGALAAVTTAALGSRLGYAGTLAGAGIASVLAAFASTLYTRGLERTRDGVKKIVLRDADGETKVITVPVEEETDTVVQSASGPAGAGPRRRGWRRPLAVIGGVVATAAVTFVVAMGLVTGWEFGTGKSLDGGKGTTIGQASNDRPTPKPTPSASATPTAKPTPSATPTTEATPTVAPTSPAATQTPTPTPTPTASTTRPTIQAQPDAGPVASAG